MLISEQDNNRKIGEEKKNEKKKMIKHAFHTRNSEFN